MGTGLRVTSCDTDESLVVAAGLFNHYRHHYGESDGDSRAREWLSEMVRTRQLVVYVAFTTSGPDDDHLTTAPAPPPDRPLTIR